MRRPVYKNTNGTLCRPDRPKTSKENDVRENKEDILQRACEVSIQSKRTICIREMMRVEGFKRGPMADQYPAKRLIVNIGESAS